MKPDFAPRGIGELLDAALALLRTHAKTVFGAAAVTLFPIALLLGVLQSFMVRGYLASIPAFLSSAAEGAPPEGFERMTALSSVLNAASTGYLLISAFFGVALIQAMPALLHGVKMTPLELLKGGWRRLVWYVLAWVMLYIVLGVVGIVALPLAFFTFGIGLLAVGAVYVWLIARLCLTPVVAVAEEANPLAAMSRSWTLTAGRAWRVVGFALGLGILLQVVMAAVNSPAIVRQVVDVLMNAPPDNPLLAMTRPVAPGWKLMEGLLYAIAATIVAPAATVAWFLFYLDLRSRRDGMDLVARAAELQGGR